MSIDNLRKMTKEELVSEKEKTYKELFNLRMQKSSGQLAQLHLIPAAKKTIARIETLLGQQVTENAK